MIFYAYVLGLLSILSPCTAILIPVLLADPTKKLRRILTFLAGITLTFTVLGAASASTGMLLTNVYGMYLYLFAAVITLLAGISLLGLFSFPSLFHHKTHNDFVLGLVYGGVALGCVGPQLAAVLSLIVARADIVIGVAMMFLFSLGFITPFVVFGYGIKDKRVHQKILRYAPQLRRYGGYVLMIVGLYLLFVALRYQ